MQCDATRRGAARSDERSEAPEQLADRTLKPHDEWHSLIEMGLYAGLRCDPRRVVSRPPDVRLERSAVFKPGWLDPLIHELVEVTGRLPAASYQDCRHTSAPHPPIVMSMLVYRSSNALTSLRASSISVNRGVTGSCAQPPGPPLHTEADGAGPPTSSRATLTS